MHDPWTLFRARALAVLIPALVAAAVYHWWPEIEGRALLISLSEQEERARLEAARRDMWFGDFEAARATLEPMAYGGLTQAQSYLGRIHLYHNYHLASLSVGRKWVERAIFAGDDDAKVIRAYAEVYGYWPGIFRRNPVEVIHELAETGNGFALAVLAGLYRYGVAVGKDQEQAGKLALQAARAEYLGAPLLLADMLWTGDLPDDVRDAPDLNSHWFALWDKTGDIVPLVVLGDSRIEPTLTGEERHRLGAILARPDVKARLKADTRFWETFDLDRTLLEARDHRSAEGRLAMAYLHYAYASSVAYSEIWAWWSRYLNFMYEFGGVSGREALNEGQALAADWLRGESLVPAIPHEPDDG